jgi:hypothetical protein
MPRFHQSTTPISEQQPAQSCVLRVKKQRKIAAIWHSQLGMTTHPIPFKPFAVLVTAIAGLFLSASKPASGQTTEIPKYYHKWLDCAVTGGPSGFSSPCGVMKHYEYIFIGSVMSIDPISEQEKWLQLQSREIFLGDPVDQLTVTTSKGNCLHEIQPGDEWLFYLFRNDKTKELVLGQGNPSGPIAETEATIALLRRLSRMTDSGVIIGSVQDTLLRDGGAWTEYINTPNHQVIAKRLSDGIEYSAFSDSEGRYEFQSLTSGTYHITSNTVPGLWAADGDTDVSPASCAQINFALSTDGQISGHVASADGRPFQQTPWVEVQSDDPHFSKSTPLDDQGYYQLRGLTAGRYLVGIGITAQPDSFEWRSRIYYPGVHSKQLAATVDLGTNQIRTGIDFSFTQPPVEQNKDAPTQDTQSDQSHE